MATKKEEKAAFDKLKKSVSGYVSINHWTRRYHTNEIVSLYSAYSEELGCCSDEHPTPMEAVDKLLEKRKL